MKKWIGITSSLFMLLQAPFAWSQETLRVALLMPFCSKQEATTPGHAHAELAQVSRSYFQGMRIALDSFEALGTSIKLNVFDTQNDSLVTLKLIQKPAFREMDLVIGPILQGGNKMLTKFAAECKVYHVSPLMTFSKTKLNDPYWVSCNPDLPSFAQIMLDYIHEQYDSANVIVISDQSTLDKSISPAFKKLTASYKSIRIKLVPFSATTDINASFSHTLRNVVIIPTAKEQVANEVLFQIKDTANLTCIGFQQWFEFKNADIQLWEHKKVQFATTFFVDYHKEATKQFIQRYRDQFFTEPDEAAFKGYDQALFFISQRLKYGKDFMEEVIDCQPLQMIHTTFRFQRNKEGGAYQNAYLNFIWFNGDRLERVE